MLAEKDNSTINIPALPNVLLIGETRQFICSGIMPLFALITPGFDLK